MTKGVQNNVVPQSYPVCWMKDTGARSVRLYSEINLLCTPSPSRLLPSDFASNSQAHSTLLFYGATTENRSGVAVRVAPLYHDIS